MLLLCSGESPSISDTNTAVIDWFAQPEYVMAAIKECSCETLTSYSKQYNNTPEFDVCLTADEAM